MAENKTQPTKLRVAAFLNLFTDAAQRADAKAGVKRMQSASGEKPRMWGPSIIGFGRHRHRYESGHEGDMPLIGFSPRKRHDSVGTGGSPATPKRRCPNSASTPPTRAAST